MRGVKLRWSGPVAVVAAVGVLLAGCQHGTQNAAGGHSPSPVAASPASVTISPGNGRTGVSPSTPIAVTVTGGTLRHVEVHTAGDPVEGTLSVNRRSWHSTGHLNLDRAYEVTATAVNGAGKTSTTTSSFRTLAAGQTVHAHTPLAYRATYGVGMPIEIDFDRAVTRKAAVERSLKLTTSRSVVGAWYWPNSRQVRFRPRDYWPAHTTVRFDAMLDGVEAAPGVYGDADLWQRFTIGTSLIVVASTRSHRLHLYRDGTLLHNWKISTGQPGHDTPNGTYLTINKANPEEMKPDDIAPGQPGYYDLNVPWSVRFTWSGDFLHDAYWSVSEQGHTNVSHGCVNMTPQAAETYYKMAVPGDPVTITGSPLAGTPGDGWTDWFLSWTQVLHRSALHQAVQAGPDGSTFVNPDDVPASTATPPTGTAAANNAAAS